MVIQGKEAARQRFRQWSNEAGLLNTEDRAFKERARNGVENPEDSGIKQNSVENRQILNDLVGRVRRVSGPGNK